MKNDKYANLTTQQLRKRKKVASVLVVILIAAVVLDGAAVIYDIMTGDGFNTTLLVSALSCAVILMPISIGKKKIEEELIKKGKTHPEWIDFKKRT